MIKKSGGNHFDDFRREQGLSSLDVAEAVSALTLTAQVVKISTRKQMLAFLVIICVVAGLLVS